MLPAASLRKQLHYKIKSECVEERGDGQKTQVLLTHQKQYGTVKDEPSRL